MYKYYLETNSLYSIGKFSGENLGKSFTSALALFEIISNIKPDNYIKRKSILRKIMNGKVFIDWQFPQEIAFKSFDYFDDFTFIDERLPQIESMIDLILNSGSYEELINTSESIELNLKYFEEADKNTAASFIKSTADSIIKLKALEQKSEPSIFIKVAGQTYDLSNSNELRNLFNDKPAFNDAFSILALAKMLQSMFPDHVENEKDLEQLYSSYNGATDIYIANFSKYCANKFFNRELPATNDFLDLSHLFYLRNHSSVYIVSNDKIYEQLSVNTAKPNTLILNS
jgi:hypothetical protein